MAARILEPLPTLERTMGCWPCMGLALSNRFDKVVGVDVSQQALQDGALFLLDTVNYQRLLAKKGELVAPSYY
jgi:hypothetical protein